MWLYRIEEEISINLDKVMRIQFTYDHGLSDRPWGINFELFESKWVRYHFKTEKERIKYFNRLRQEVGMIIIDETDEKSNLTL